MKRILLIGASSDRTKYSYRAFHMLRDNGYEVIPVNPSGGSLDNVEFIRNISDIDGEFYAATVYVREKELLSYTDDLKRLGPLKVILNPGTEGEIIESALSDLSIRYIKACTLVLLSTGQFEKFVNRI